MIHISAPGKLFISGEWAVLELENPGIVAAVDKRVHCIISDLEEKERTPMLIANRELNEISISVDDFNIKDIRCYFDGSKLVFPSISDYEKEKLQFIKEGIEVALRYVKEKSKIKNFKVRTWGEQSEIEGKKIGFGSSAAATVAVVAAILAFHNLDIKKEEIYKLSAIAHYFAQGKVGSAFDIAASTYGGIFVYKRFDPDWLIKELNKKISTIVEEKWPHFYVEELNIPEDFILLVAWTKESASTSAMIKQMNEFKKNRKEEYDLLMKKISLLVSDLINAWKSEERKNILELLRENEVLLRELGQKSSVNIETPELKKLSDIANKYGAGKLSGAGGGDCGIAVCFDVNVAEKIKKEWKNSGLYPLDVAVDRDGIREEI